MNPNDLLLFTSTYPSLGESVRSWNQRSPTYWSVFAV